MWPKRYVTTSVLFLLMMIVLPIHITAANSTTVAVNPASSSAAVGENITVNITVTDVTNLAVWEIQMFYRNTILSCTNTAEGPFLKSGGNTTFFASTVNNAYNATHGWLMIGSTLMGQPPGVNGSGTLAMITFKALASGDTPLTLTGTTLKDATAPPRNPIPHTAIGGTVHVTGAAQVHDLAVTAITTSKQGCTPAPTIGRGYALQINVTVENQGNYAESFFDVWAELSLGVPPPITVGPTTVASLGIGETITLTFNWGTAGAAYGNYTVTGVVETVSGETNTGNNRLNDVYIFVTLPGDINGDQFVNAKDAVLLGVAFSSERGDIRYTLNADINGDGYCNAKDAVILGGNFGKSW